MLEREGGKEREREGLTAVHVVISQWEHLLSHFSQLPKPCSHLAHSYLPTPSETDSM